MTRSGQESGNKNKGTKCAFTLAEVLITLGIIGVVAALTLPTLIQNYKKKEVTTKLQKVYSVMNQAINLSSAVNGEPKDWYLDCGKHASATCSTEDVQIWFENYIGKYLQGYKTEIKPKIKAALTSTEANTNLFVYLNDGTILEIPNYIYDIVVYLDAKAIQAPKAGHNYFNFRYRPVISSDTNLENIRYCSKTGLFEPYCTYWDGTREGLTAKKLGGTNFGCDGSSSEQAYCAKLIQIDGWEIRDDYPW